MARSPRYNVEVAFITSGGKAFGKTEYGQLMNSWDVDLCLKILNPIKYSEWISEVKKLRRGMFYKIQCINSDETYGQVLKQVTITRN